MFNFKLSTRLAAATLAGNLVATEAMSADERCINNGHVVALQTDCNRVFGNQEPERSNCRKANGQRLTNLQNANPDWDVIERTSPTQVYICVEPKFQQ